MSHWCQGLHTLRSEERREGREGNGRGGRGEGRGEGRGKGERRGERGGGRGATTINGNFSLIREKLNMHLAHTN